MNILREFEKRYKGDPSKTEEICEKIAHDFGIFDPVEIEDIKDYVYLHRYEEDEEGFEEGDNGAL